jgi:para-aminobenzoate synthetase component I
VLTGLRYAIGTAALRPARTGRWLVLEHGHPDPFGALEAYLAEHRGRAADLYLGYGLAASLAGVHAPQPAEPCPLPAAACRVLDDPAPRAAGGFRIGPWRPTWTAAAHRRTVREVRAAIARGDVYQVNAVQHLRALFEGDPLAVGEALRPLQAPFAAALEGDGWAVVCASPELFLRTRGDRVWTMPIKGTRPAGDRTPIASSAKDRAEHVMIVDLERNDLGRVCRPGSVRVAEFLRERPMAGVRHLVSTVEGRLRPGVGTAELLRATFPGGSVTGAPKLAAIDRIARLEPVGRGASMGALGRVHPNGDLELGLTIRTFAIADGEIHLWVGGGIVWDSDPAAEHEESLVKARPLLRLLSPAGS